MSAEAAPADPARSLSNLVDSGQFKLAYKWALNERDTRIGQPNFDYYYGRAATETGHLNEAIFAFQRVLMAQPGADRVRLELARAYFLHGDDRSARVEFKTVQAHQPPANVADKIERYLQVIRRRSGAYKPTFSGYVEAGAGYDTNANSATSSDSVQTILGPLSLDPEAKKQADGYGHIQARARASVPIAPDVDFFGSLGLRGRFYPNDSDFNIGFYNGRVGTRLRKHEWRLHAALDFGRYFVDDQAYRDQFGFDLGYDRRLTKQTLLSFSLNALHFQYYDNRDYLDADLWLVGTSLTHAFGGPLAPVLSAGAYAGVQRANDTSLAARANAERSLEGVQAGVQLQLLPSWQTSGTVGFRHSSYDSAGLLFTRARDEDYYRVEWALNWRPNTKWRIGPRVIYENNDSNVAIYDYDRTRVELLARYNFF